MAKKKLDRLKSKLPAKWGNKIHERTNLSKSYIYKVMDGEKENLEVVRAAIILASEHARELKELGLTKKNTRK